MSSINRISTLKKKTIHGTIQLITREAGMKVIVIIGQLTLVKILEPSLFGIFAILSFLLNTAEVFTDIGLNFTVIQSNKKPTDRQLNAIFTIKLLLTFCVIIVLNALTPIIKNIYPNLIEGYGIMLFILSLTILLRPLQTLSSSLLERELRYKEIAVIDLIGMTVYYSTAIILAYANFGLWSFIWAVVTMSISECFITFRFYRWIPRISFNFSEAKIFIDLGKFFQISLYLTVIRNSVIPIMAGSRLPLREVGLLDWSYNTSSFPRVFIDNLGRVSFSSFSRIQDNKDNIARSISQAFSLLCIAATLAIPITYIFGYDSIYYLINDRWLDALPALNWYVLSIFFLNGSGLFGHALLAIGKVREMVVSGAIVTFFEIIVSYLLLIHLGFEGIAIGFFLSSILVFSLSVFLAHRNGIKVNLIPIFYKNSAILILSMMSFFTINLILPNTFVYYIVKIFLSLGLYILIVFIVTPNELKLALSLLRNNSFKQAK